MWFWQNNSQLGSQFSVATTDLERVRYSFDEISKNMSKLQSQLLTAQTEVQVLKNKYDADMAIKVEEFDDLKWVPNLSWFDFFNFIALITESSLNKSKAVNANFHVCQFSYWHCVLALALCLWWFWWFVQPDGSCLLV